VGLIGELCEAQGIAWELRRITREEVFAADELMLTSATREILPITRIDGQPVGDGRPGPIYKRLFEAYQAAKLAA
jgi:D-alanine transaminase